MKPSPIRLVLADEHLSYIESLATCINAEDDMSHDYDHTQEQEAQNIIAWIVWAIILRNVLAQ